MAVDLLLSWSSPSCLPFSSGSFSSPSACRSKELLPGHLDLLDLDMSLSCSGHVLFTLLWCRRGALASQMRCVISDTALQAVIVNKGLAGRIL